jgi:aerobic-type carbon monoxide dehydrogenase small subunit (CoxS/CutS family)
MIKTDIMATINLNINGKKQAVNVNLMGTKYGCGVAQCGACTIHLNGVATRSCVLPVSAIGEKEITTIEGLSENGDHSLQKAWIEHDVPQCGYCQAGQIMTAAALLKSNPKPSDADIENAMNGNLCRCGTYLRIKAAIKTAAKV